MEFPESRILVFCKAPVPGKVKTRLAHSVGDIHAAQLHASLAQHCLQNLTSAGVAPVQLWCAPDVDHQFFQQCRDIYDVELHQQAGGDLGDKMLHAIDRALADARHCVVVGTDCPTIDAPLVREALSALTAGSDGVICPAEDGGYVLLGLTRPMPALFSDIPWGTEAVLAQTRLKMVGQWRELATHWDVDRWDDVRRLRDCAQHLRLDSRLVTLLETLNYNQG